MKVIDRKVAQIEHIIVEFENQLEYNNRSDEYEKHGWKYLGGSAWGNRVLVHYEKRGELK